MFDLEKLDRFDQGLAVLFGAPQPAPIYEADEPQQQEDDAE